MKLWAIADLHVGFRENREGLEALEHHPDDWLILAGDAGDTPTQLDAALRAHPELTRRELAGKLRISEAALYKKLRQHGLTS